jgi:hypothetical protein
MGPFSPHISTHLSNDLRPITTVPVPSKPSCISALSASVGSLNIQSCRVSAPSPNGFSRLSLGPVT